MIVNDSYWSIMLPMIFLNFLPGFLSPKCPGLDSSEMACMQAGIEWIQPPGDSCGIFWKRLCLQLSIVNHPFWGDHHLESNGNLSHGESNGRFTIFPIFSHPSGWSGHLQQASTKGLELWNIEPCKTSYGVALNILIIDDDPDWWS